MIGFNKEDSDEFLGDDFGFMNTKNPFYPTLEQWMQLDSQKIHDVQNQSEYLNKQTILFSTCTDNEINNTNPHSCEQKNSIDHMLQELISMTRVHKQCELKNRRDVLNKSILRAVKRQIMSEFKSYHVYKQLKTRNRALDHFKDSLNKFTRVFMNTNNFSETYNLFGYLFDYRKFTEIINRDHESHYDEIATFAADFNDCCTYYTHKKFEHVISNHHFKVLYKIFKENGIESFLEVQDKTSHNLQSYTNAIQIIEEQIELN